MRSILLPPLFDSVLVVTDVTAHDIDERLTTSERESIARFRSETQRLERAAARIAAKEIARRLGAEIRELELTRGDTGPRFSPDLGLDISLSHSHGWGAAAVSRERVGVDIERTREVEDRLAKFFLHGDEVELLRSLSVPRAMLHFWSAKEAAFKYARTATLLKDVRFADATIDPAGLTLRFSIAGATGIVSTIEHTDGFVLALARERSR